MISEAEDVVAAVRLAGGGLLSSSGSARAEDLEWATSSKPEMGMATSGNRLRFLRSCLVITLNRVLVHTSNTIDLHGSHCDE